MAAKARHAAMPCRRAAHLRDAPLVAMQHVQQLQAAGVQHARCACVAACGQHAAWLLPAEGQAGDDACRRVGGGRWHG